MRHRFLQYQGICRISSTHYQVCSDYVLLFTPHETHTEIVGSVLEILNMLCPFLYFGFFLVAHIFLEFHFKK